LDFTPIFTPISLPNTTKSRSPSNDPLKHLEQSRYIYYTFIHIYIYILFIDPGVYIITSFFSFLHPGGFRGTRKGVWQGGKRERERERGRAALMLTTLLATLQAKEAAGPFVEYLRRFGDDDKANEVAGGNYLIEYTDMPLLSSIYNTIIYVSASERVRRYSRAGATSHRQGGRAGNKQQWTNWKMGRGLMLTTAACSARPPPERPP